MPRSIVLFLVASVLVGCSAPPSAPPPPNRWADVRLRPVLEAQEHRDTRTLCALLKDTAVTVRAAAALALASVQDTAARPCLLRALDDPGPEVRRNAAFALGWVADSVALDLLSQLAAAEGDTAVARVMITSAFRAELRLFKHDAAWYISFLESDEPDIRIRAAQTLARLPREELVGATEEVMMAIDSEHDPAVRMFLVGALKHNATPAVTDKLKALATSDSLAAIRIMALRALGTKEDAALAPFILECVDDADPGVQQTAVEQLQRIKGSLDGDAIWKIARLRTNHSVKLPLCGLVMKHGSERVREECGALLKSMCQQDLGTYVNAALISALGPTMPMDTLMILVRSTRPAVERQAAYAVAMEQVRERMMRSRYSSVEAQYVELAALVGEVLRTGDAGLISSAAEMIDQEDAAVIELLLPTGSEELAYAPLHPIRDLETRMLLDKVVARRDGKEAPKHIAPSFNHPIDLARLGMLKEGQRYRITTPKGEIMLALEPTAAPGSCVAFDSLVTAGYYNGKAFHRIVPNFVAQGGCPRGDGYGGMPWTLRTEIGLQGFVEGAVGLASAGRDTESCQFFIMTASAPHLDGKYTRFGHVVSGMDVAKTLQVGDVMTRVERVE